MSLRPDRLSPLRRAALRSETRDRRRVPVQHAAGRVHDVALTDAPDLKGWRVFLCGHPDMVQQVQMRAYLAGASLTDIHADAFTVDTSPE